MNRVQTLRKGRKSPGTIWLSFTRQYNIATNRWYLFFEGDDDPTFYLPLLRHTYAGAEFAPFVCDGKDGVLETLRTLNAKKPDAVRCLFFVDKDLDDLLDNHPPHDPRLFITTTYSIENYLVNRAAFDVVWQEIWRANDISPEVKGTLYQHSKRLIMLFRRRVLPLMAWLIVAKRRHKINLNDTPFAKIFTCDIAETPKVLRNKSVRLRILQASSVDDDQVDLGFLDLLEIARQLKGRDPQTYVRGKYELAAWVCGLNSLAALLREQHDIRAHPLSASTIIRELAGKVPYPQELRNFVLQHNSQRESGL